MDTKRCLRCHKLLRADARKCSLCGYIFLQAPIRRSSKTTNGSRHQATASFPSNPPASPHRAGHYSGLHPEDQPYQSSFMPILRPPAITRRLDEDESEDVLEPIAVSSTPPIRIPGTEKEQTPKRYVATPVPTLSPKSQRSTRVRSYVDTGAPLLEVEPPPPIPESMLHEQMTMLLPISAHLAGKRKPRSGLVRILIIAAILSLLLATSISMYLVVFAGIGATVTASPSPVLTVGPSPLPAMTISTNALTFNAIQGKNPAQQTFTLTNPGNAPLNWAITGDAKANAFLSLAPKSGTLAPGSSIPITVTPNIGISNAGVINATLTIQDTDSRSTVKSQLVAVKITISNSNQALISVSTTSLTCHLSSTNTSYTQQLKISNSGSARLNWTLLSQPLPAWISVDTTSGSLTPGYIAFVNVACNNTALQAGTYTYKLVVSDTDAQTPVAAQNVLVTLTVT